MLEEIKKTAAFIDAATSSFAPEVGIILGTGLGGFADKIDTAFAIEYKDIPGFPVSTVEGHKGRMIFGTVEGRKVEIPVGGIRGGLALRGGESGFELRDTEGNWHEADLRIRGNTLELSSAEVPAPTGVRYAWGNVNTLTVYHKSGLPLPPFTFDTEPKTTAR